MTRILSVDDGKLLRLATKRALARAGEVVCTASDGENALEVARQEHPDLTVLDMLLPKMAGPDVLKALKKDPKTADRAVVVLTGLWQKMRRGCNTMAPSRFWRNPNSPSTRVAAPCCLRWRKSSGSSGWKFLATHDKVRVGSAGQLDRSVCENSSWRIRVETRTRVLAAKRHKSSWREPSKDK